MVIDSALNLTTSLNLRISNVHPVTLKAIGGQVINISGTFPSVNTTTGNPSEVKFGDQNCTVISHNQLMIRCISSDIDPGSYNLTVHFPATGYGKLVWDRPIQFKLSVDGMTPDQGSLAGGTLVKINGTGFGSNKSNVDVLIGKYPCDIRHVNDSSIECVTRGVGETFHIRNNATDPGKK